MKRYHKKVYFSANDNTKLKQFTDNLNNLVWGYSKHSLDNLKYRVYDIRGLLSYIKGLRLNCNDIFEYYTDNIGNIIKGVYRVNYQGLFDLCLVISKNKNIVTIYINNIKDNHETLNKSNYVSN